MDYRTFHPEDVKAAIRKRFGSLTKFEERHRLPRQSVADLLRGRTSARVAAVVNAVLVMEDAVAAPRPSVIPVSATKQRGAHRLNREAA